MRGYAAYDGSVLGQVCGIGVASRYTVVAPRRAVAAGKSGTTGIGGGGFDGGYCTATSGDRSFSLSCGGFLYTKEVPVVIRLWWLIVLAKACVVQRDAGTGGDHYISNIQNEKRPLQCPKYNWATPADVRVSVRRR